MTPYTRSSEAHNTLALNVQPFSRYVSLNHGKGTDGKNKGHKFFSRGENTTFIYDEHGILRCANCGSYQFDMVAEMRITDVSKDGNDPVANRTVESENIISIACARCGARVK